MMTNNKINAARNLQKMFRVGEAGTGQEITEPGKCIFGGIKSGKASQSKRHMARILRGFLGRRTDKDNIHEVQNDRVLWKKSKCFESSGQKALVLLQGAWGQEVPSIWRKKELKLL